MRLPRPRPGYPMPYAVGMCIGTGALGIVAAVLFAALLAWHPTASSRVLAIVGLVGAAFLLAVASVMCVYSVYGKPYRRELRLPWQKRPDGD